MSLNAPSLPSFAQTFGVQPLSAIASTNALPPIHMQSLVRKRSHDRIASHSRSPEPTITLSPPVKEELSPPSPDASSPSLKRRRVTVSGAPSSQDLSASSPVVMAFPINKRDTAPPSDQLRSANPHKQQKQKPLIDQHRPNGIVSSDDRLSTAAPSSKPSVVPPPRAMRRSPNIVSSIRKPCTNVASSGTRPPSPNNPVIASVQQPLSISARTSFARRRAGQLGTGKKPADILISPRDPTAPDQRPVIQSAPPIPDRSQSAMYTDRLPIALPRLPSILNSADNVRRVASNVPPTPTRLSLQQRPPSSTIQAPAPAGIPVRSPPAASIPIATTLVPPTPSALHHPGYAGDKAAFLAPFENFYDALNDSKELKKWLSEQLQKSNLLMQTLAQQQEKMSDTVEALVERSVAGMRSEITSLQRRVEELEEALRISDWQRHHESHPGSSWAQERDVRENQEISDIEVGSPAFRPSLQNYRENPDHRLHPPPKPSRSVGRSPNLTNRTAADTATS